MFDCSGPTRRPLDPTRRLPTNDGRPPLFTIGQPMDASGFPTLALHHPDSTWSPMTCAAWAAARKDGRVGKHTRSMRTTCTPSSTRSVLAR